MSNQSVANTPNETLSHYRRLQAALRSGDGHKAKLLLPVLDSCSLVDTPLFQADMNAGGHAKLWQEILAFKPLEGWLCFQSAVEKITGGQLPVLTDELGWLLNGELVDADGNSLHIWQSGSGWLAKRFIEQEAGTADDCLVETTELLSKDSNEEYLRYRVYWKKDAGGSQGFQRFSSRFIGFVSEEKR